jgi:hypothetical protein
MFYATTCCLVFAQHFRNASFCTLYCHKKIITYHCRPQPVPLSLTCVSCVSDRTHHTHWVEQIRGWSEASQNVLRYNYTSQDVPRYHWSQQTGQWLTEWKAALPALWPGFDPLQRLVLVVLSAGGGWRVVTGAK